MSIETGLVITDAGIAEVINAEHTGTTPVVLTEVGFGTGKYTAGASRTKLDAEFKRLDTLSGGAVGDNVIHLTVSDNTTESYSVFEVGVYTASGTLFAVYSQTTPVIQKASGSEILLALDFALTNVDPESVTVGDTNFILNPATTSRQGVVELATADETIAGADSSRVVTPAGLSARTATTGRRGLVELATAAEAITGTDGDRAITPAALTAAFVKEHLTTGYQKLPNGLILQWGQALIAQDGTTRITLPTAFPSVCVFAGAFSLGEVQPSYSISTKDVNYLIFKHDGNGGIESAWFALGY
jgi:hypothetical protein